MATKADRLISLTVVDERIEKLETWAKENGRFAGPEFRNTTEYMLAEMREAVKKAGEAYRSTSETVRMTGWDRKTLLRHAHAFVNGERLPRGWGQLRVRQDGRGYSFMVSTVPVRRHNRSA